MYFLVLCDTAYCLYSLFSLFPGLWQIHVSSVASLCWLWPHRCGSPLHNPWPSPSAWQCYSSGSPQDWKPLTPPACCSRGCGQLMRWVWANWGFLCLVFSPSMGFCYGGALDLQGSCWMSQPLCCHRQARYTAHLAGFGVLSVCAFQPCGFGTIPDGTKEKEIDDVFINNMYFLNLLKTYTVHFQINGIIRKIVGGFLAS